MGRKRRTFSDAFKAEAVRLVRDEGKTVAAAARALDLAESALRLWVRDAERDARRRARGECRSRKRVARLMRRAGLVARRRRAFRITTLSRHTDPVAPNRLARQFTVAAPDRVWVTDITYLATVEGWLYLAVVLDVFSRRIVGWATSDRLGEGVALEALGMGLTRRRPQPGLLHHS